MNKKVLCAVVLGTTLMVSSAGVFAEEILSTTVTSDQFVSIQLPSEEWKEAKTANGIVFFTDGDNEIQIEVFKRTAKLPEVTLADEGFESVYESYYSNKKFVIVTTGLVLKEEDYQVVKKSIDSMKLDLSVAESHITNSETTKQEVKETEKTTAKETEKTTEKTSEKAAEVLKTDASTMLVDDSGSYIIVYEYTDGILRDENGVEYYTSEYQNGYYSGSDGSSWRSAGDRGNNIPDYVTYGADGIARELYLNDDGTARDLYGNQYQNAGDAGWIDYYGNHYYEDYYRDDYERNDYTKEDYSDDYSSDEYNSEESGDDYIYFNSQYITSVDGETRLVYWQNEFYAIDDYGNEYIYSGYDGSLTSSDGLTF